MKNLIFDPAANCRRCGEKITVRDGPRATRIALNKGYCSPSCQSKDSIRLYVVMTGIFFGITLIFSLILSGSPIEVFVTILNDFSSFLSPYGYLGLIPILTLFIGVIFGVISLYVYIVVLIEMMKLDD